MMSYNDGYHHLYQPDDQLDHLERFEERLSRIEGKLTGLCKWLNKNHDIGIPDEFLIETEDGNYHHGQHDDDNEDYIEEEEVDEDDEEPSSNDVVLEEDDIKPSFDVEEPEAEEPSILSDLNFENNNEDQYQEQEQSPQSHAHLINELYQNNNSISITPIISTNSSLSHPHNHNTPTSTTSININTNINNSKMPNLIPFNFKQVQLQQQLQRLQNHPHKILVIPPQSQLRNMNNEVVNNIFKIKQRQQLWNKRKTMRYLEANSPSAKLPPKVIENNSVTDKTCSICKKEFFGSQIRQRIQRHLERIHKIEIDRSPYKIRIRRNKLIGYPTELRDDAVSLFNKLLPGKVIQPSFYCPVCPKLSPKLFEGSQLRARFARHLFRIHQIDTGFKIT